ncbi:MAG: VacJ family lipoprotein [Proteobacteria bacterium]|nr:VacJ family lipoprotein [Pseudomonadota bacterium]
MGSIRLFALLCLGLVASGCASTGGVDSQNDPYETSNRQVFEFNQKLDEHVARPVAVFYSRAVPRPLRSGIHNVLANLALPLTFVNDVLQGEAKRAAQTFGRFTLNSTVGIGGLFDPATRAGIPVHTEDFGQTLAVYGADEGPYLMLPLIGPDNPRDLVGQVADIFLDPFTYVSYRSDVYWNGGRAALDVVDSRASNIKTIDAMESTSIDYYATVRSLYRQNRNQEIRNGKPDLDNLPDF